MQLLCVFKLLMYFNLTHTMITTSGQHIGGR